MGIIKFVPREGYIGDSIIPVEVVWRDVQQVRCLNGLILVRKKDEEHFRTALEFNSCGAGLLAKTAPKESLVCDTLKVSDSIMTYGSVGNASIGNNAFIKGRLCRGYVLGINEELDKDQIKSIHGLYKDSCKLRNTMMDIEFSGVFEEIELLSNTVKGQFKRVCISNLTVGNTLHMSGVIAEATVGNAVQIYHCNVQKGIQQEQ